MSEPVIPPTFSASQIEKYIECPRKWGWRYIAKIEPEEQGKGASLGSDTHAILEKLLKGDPQPYDTVDKSVASEVAWQIAQHLPDPSTPGIQVEQSFGFSSPRTGYIYRGFIDWAVRGWPRPEDDTVGDHKTSSNISMWAKTPEDLKTDIQATIYAMQKMSEWKTPKIRLQWTYGQTKGARKSLPVIQEVYSADVAKRFAEIEVIAGEMAELKKTISVDDVGRMNYNPQACESFGGCPYRHLCNLDPMERMFAQMDKANKELTMTDNSGMSLVERLRARASDAPAPAETSGSKVTIDWSKAPADAVNPPESALPPAPPVNVPAPAPIAALAQALGEAPVLAPASVDVVQGMSDAMDAVVKLAAETMPGATPRRGRPPGSKNKPRTSDQPTTPAPATEQAPAVEAEAFPATFPPGRIPVLFIDCMPTGMDVWHLSTIVAEATKRIEAQEFRRQDGSTYHVADYRYLEFGKGPGVLCAVVAEILTGPLPSICMESHTPEGVILLNLLLSRAAITVRGM